MHKSTVRDRWTQDDHRACNIQTTEISSSTSHIWGPMTRVAKVLILFFLYISAPVQTWTIQTRKGTAGMHTTCAPMCMTFNELQKPCLIATSQPEKIVSTT